MNLDPPPPGPGPLPPIRGEGRRVEWWGRRGRKLAVDALATVGPPMVVAALGLAVAIEYRGPAIVAEWIIALIAAAVSIRSRDTSVKWGALVVFLACLQASVVGMYGFGTLSVVVTLVMMAACLAVRLAWNVRVRSGSVKSQIERARLQNIHARTEVTYKRLDKMSEPPPREPDLRGRNATETDIRQAVWSVFGQELVGCDARTREFGWEARVQLPPGLERAKLGRDWGRVASAMGVPGDFDVSDGGLSNELVVRYLESDPLQEPVPYEPQSESASFRDLLRLGRDGFGAQCLIDPAYNHFLIGGSSKFGKSGIVKLLCLRLAERPDTALIGVDMKPGAPELSSLRPIFQDLAQTVDQARALFEWLAVEMHERGAIMTAAGDALWDPARHGRPALFVVVDELAELIRQGDQVGKGQPGEGQVRMSMLVESALAMARAYGIHLILSTQQPSNRVFGKSTDARGNLAIRICVRMNDPGHGRFVFGGGSWRPSDLDLPGKFLIQSPDHGAPWPYRAEWVTDRVAQDEVSRLGRERVPSPIGNRLILPADRALGNSDRVLERLGNYGPMTRRELELATGLDKAQVLRATRSAGDRVRQYEVAGQNLWRIVA